MTLRFRDSQEHTGGTEATWMSFRENSCMGMKVWGGVYVCVGRRSKVKAKAQKAAP